MLSNEDGIANLKILRSSIGSKFTVLNRESLELIFEEQKLSLSGLTDQNKSIEAGLIAGAQLVLLLDFGCRYMRELIELSVLDTQTSQIVWSVTAVGADFEEFCRLLEKLYSPQ